MVSHVKSLYLLLWYSRKKEIKNSSLWKISGQDNLFSCIRTWYLTNIYTSTNYLLTFSLRKHPYFDSSKVETTSFTLSGRVLGSQNNSLAPLDTENWSNASINKTTILPGLTPWRLAWNSDEICLISPCENMKIFDY